MLADAAESVLHGLGMSLPGLPVFGVSESEHGVSGSVLRMAGMGMYASVRGWLEASHDLIRVSCRTPHQMTLANALCRAWEERG